MNSSKSITFFLISIVLLFLIPQGVGSSGNENNYDDEIINEVKTYAESLMNDDSLVEVSPDIWAKQSNYYGVELYGETYYYSLAPHQSFDPLTREELKKSEITIIYKEEQDDFPIMIYTTKR